MSLLRSKSATCSTEMELKYPYLMENVLSRASEKKFTVISTFSGGGGSSLGYKLAGGDVLAALEFVDKAADTYQANFPGTPVLRKDVREVTGKELLEAAGAGAVDILDGSPPCSAFSMSGRREKDWGKTKSYSTGKTVTNIEDLFFEFVRLVDEIQPKVFIAENVSGLTVGEAHKKLMEFINAFERVGYSCSWKLVNAKDHGAPQNRERTIIIGVRREILVELNISDMELESTVFPDPLPFRRTVREALAGLEIPQSELDETARRNGPNTVLRKVFESYPVVNETNEIMKGDSHWIPFELNSGKNFFNMKKLSWILPSPTVTASDGSGGSGLIHPGENRKLVPIEFQRIMALPDDYINLGNCEIRTERIGRMHCPFPLARISDKIYREILSKIK